MIRRYIVVKGIVQGVGFRPFVYRIALKYGLKGTVKNTSKGVYIDIQGQNSKVNSFLIDLRQDAPELSKIEEIIIEERPLSEFSEFKIISSRVEEKGITLISPDIATCDQCVSEVMDSSNKTRYLYPFTNCTNCGPRFSIIKNIPYDRKVTTMSEFEMCHSCSTEYINPTNRRFHAEPTCCNRCGPKLTLIDHFGNIMELGPDLVEVKELLKKGKIVGIKGVGGFNLICDGKNSEVIDTLRERKRRRSKPLALMMKNTEVVEKYCKINLKEREILTGNRKPIVLLEKMCDELPNNIVFNNNKLGVVLPYTPLHYLLFDDDLEVLVFTSGNISGVPMLYKNDEAICSLKTVADYMLVHNRDINMPVDDSVVRVDLDEERVIRSGRGYAPSSLKFNRLSGILACGSQMNNTFAISSNGYIFISPFIGHMENVESIKNFEKNLQHFKIIYNIETKVIAYDRHPSYWSKSYAEVENVKCIGVYHHHAHIVSCMAENNVNDKVIGLAFDGVGYGQDGKLWGGEFLICDYKEFKRVGHINYIPMPGGDEATKAPWKIGVSLVYKAFKEDLQQHIEELKLLLPKEFTTKNISLIVNIIKKNINSPISSSMGRLFDGVSSLLGFMDKISFQGESAIYLEKLALNFLKSTSIKNIKEIYDYDIKVQGELYIIDTDKLIKNILIDIDKKMDRGQISLKFHNTVIDFSYKLCEEIRRNYGINKVALSGGVFQNEILFKGVCTRLVNSGFTVLTHRLIPCNDEGISLGQLIVANEIISHEEK